MKAKTEWWSVGVLGHWDAHALVHSLQDVRHHSTTPPLHHSIPGSITPSLHLPTTQS
jgi:hypothetical protein